MSEFRACFSRFNASSSPRNLAYLFHIHEVDFGRVLFSRVEAGHREAAEMEHLVDAGINRTGFMYLLFSPIS